MTRSSQITQGFDLDPGRTRRRIAAGGARFDPTLSTVLYAGGQGTCKPKRGVFAQTQARQITHTQEVGELHTIAGLIRVSDKFFSFNTG